MPIIDLEHFQGFSFRIIKMEPIGGNFNTVLGGIFQKVEAHQRSLQGLAANELKANPIPADKPKRVELAYAK